MARDTASTIFRLAVVAAAAASLAACASVRPEYATRLPSQGPRVVPGGGGYKVGAPYQVNGVWYTPREQPDYDQVGVASWYGERFNLKATANGEIFDKDIPSAAHPTLPLPSLVEVTNLDNGRKLVVRVNDRGPYVDGRIIDLSEEAARELGYERAGLARVRVRYVGRAPLYGEDSIRYAKVEAPRRFAAPAKALARTPATTSAPPAAKILPPASRAADIILTAAPAPRTPPVIVQTSLAPLAGAAHAPLTGKALPDLRPRAAPPVELSAAATAPAEPAPLPAAPLPAAPATVAPSAVAAAPFRIQVGAFANPGNARRAVAQVASAGPASVLPMSRDGSTLYRVVIDAADQDQAEALREKVAQAGFADARVTGPF
jgi:rare lipoprotein A